MAAKRKTQSRITMELDDILGRVTRAEEQLKHANELLTTRHHETAEALKGVDDRLGSLERALAKYTGFWGAIMLVGSAVATFIMLAKEFFAKKFGVDA
jgi:hypothetical protein